MPTPGQAAPAAAPIPVTLTQPELSSPVESIKALLEAERRPDKRPEEPQQEQPEAPAEEPEQNAQVEGDEAPPVQQAREIPLDELEAIPLEVTIKGEDGRDVVEKPTVKELRDGYMRQKDYSRKTAELARQRNEVSEKVRQGVEAERAAYIENLQRVQQTLVDTVAPELNGVNWNDLAANDPARYVQLRNRADQVAQAHQSIDAKIKEVAEKAKAEASQAKLKAAREAREQLEADIPGFDDQLYQKLLKAGEPYGYKPDEVGQWVDARAIKLLHAAHEYQQMKADKPTTPNRVVNPPKVVRPGTQTPQPRRDAKAMERLQSSGRIEDAAAVIKSRLG